MRGRKPTPAALRELKKDPAKRHRAIMDAQGLASLTDAKTVEELPRAPRPKVDLPDWLKSERARDLYAIVVDSHQQQNIARSTDLNAYARWAFYVDQWLKMKEEMESMEGFTTTAVAKRSLKKKSNLLRPHPVIGQIAQLERLIMSLEDRIALNPVSRQSYLRGLAALPTGPAAPTVADQTRKENLAKENRPRPKEEKPPPAEPAPPKALAFMRNASREEEETAH